MNKWMKNLYRAARVGAGLAAIACLASTGHLLASSSSSSSDDSSSSSGSDHHHHKWDHWGSEHHWIAATKLGVHLEGKFWEAVKHHDSSEYKKKLSRIFQGLFSLNNSWNGTVYNRHQMACVLKSADLHCFDIFNPIGKLSKDGKVLTLTYTFVASGTQDGHVLGINNRVLSVWYKEGHCWRMVSHAGFTPF